MGLYLVCALVMAGGRSGDTHARPSAGDAFVGDVIELMDSFFACATGVLGVMVETGAFGTTCCGVRVLTAGRVAVGFEVEGARDVRGVARVAVCSALGREAVDGRFAAVVEGAMVDLLSEGVALPAALAPPMVLRTAGFLFSSPEVSDDGSGSASPWALFVPNPMRLAVAPAGARVGGLLRLDPAPARRDVLLASGFDALDGGRVVVFVVDAAAGRRAPAEAVVPLAAAGRRGGTGSFLGALEAIFLRIADEGEDGGGSECCWGLAGTLEIFAAALLRAASLAEVLEPSATILGWLPGQGCAGATSLKSIRGRGDDLRVDSKHCMQEHSTVQCETAGTCHACLPASCVGMWRTFRFWLSGSHGCQQPRTTRIRSFTSTPIASQRRPVKTQTWFEELPFVEIRL